MNVNEFMEVLRSRRSIRKFSDQVPEQQLLEQLVEAAQWAPSNHNRQGWKFIIFRDRVRIKAIAEEIHSTMSQNLKAANRLVAKQGKELLYYSRLFEQAPVVILAMHKKSPAVGRTLIDACGPAHVSSEAISTAMAVQNMLLVAHVIGLGTCVMTAPLLAAGVWEKTGDPPVGFQPTCVVAVGYADESPVAPRRKQLEHIIEYR